MLFGKFPGSIAFIITPSTLELRYTIQRGCVDSIVEGTGCYDGKQEGVS